MKNLKQQKKIRDNNLTKEVNDISYAIATLNRISNKAALEHNDRVVQALEPAIVILIRERDKIVEIVKK